MQKRPHLLIISLVYPFPRASGQQQRVFYKIKAFKEHFRITFLTIAPAYLVSEVRDELLEICDQAIVLPSRYPRHRPGKVWHRLLGSFHTLRSGLKFSNYLAAKVELPPARIEAELGDDVYDLAVFEYWHTVDSLPVFRRKGIPTVLDMHNLLWQSFARSLDRWDWLPKWWKDWAIDRYKIKEESAWTQYDGLVAINTAEFEYASQRVSEKIEVFYAPMGTDLSLWPYSWQPVQPPRLTYYGGLSNVNNQRDALFCYQRIMPHIWQDYPQAELWLVGSKPPDSLRELSQKDIRVKVTGYVDDVQDLLRTMGIILCPFSGKFGFRSRLVEVMALGIPVVASPDAVHGMGMDAGQGIILEETSAKMAQACLNLLRDSKYALEQSRLARNQMEEKFSYEATYKRLALDLFEFVRRHEQVTRQFTL